MQQTQQLHNSSVVCDNSIAVQSFAWIDVDKVFDTEIKEKCNEANQNCKEFFEFLETLRNDNDVLQAFVMNAENYERNKNRIPFIGVVLLFELIHERQFDLYIPMNVELNQLFHDLKIPEIIDYNRNKLFSKRSSKEWVDELLNNESLIFEQQHTEKEQKSTYIDDIDVSVENKEICSKKDVEIESWSNNQLTQVNTMYDQININAQNFNELNNTIDEMKIVDEVEDLYEGNKLKVLENLDQNLKSQVEFKDLLNIAKQFEKDLKQNDLRLKENYKQFEILNKIVQANFKDPKILFSLKVQIKNQLKENLECYLYSNRMFDEIAENLRNKKFIDKCERQIKQLNLKKDFNYRIELNYAKKIINSAIAKNFSKDDNANSFQKLSVIKDPLNKLETDPDFILYFKNLHTLTALNVVFKDDDLSLADKKFIMKLCVENKNLRNIVKDCIDRGSVFDYVGIEQTEALKEMINIGKQFISMHKKIENLENFDDYHKILDELKSNLTNVKLFSIDELYELSHQIHKIAERWKQNNITFDKNIVIEFDAILSQIKELYEQTQTPQIAQSLTDLTKYAYMLIGLHSKSETEFLDEHQTSYSAKPPFRR